MNELTLALAEAAPLCGPAKNHLQAGDAQASKLRRKKENNPTQSRNRVTHERETQQTDKDKKEVTDLKTRSRLKITR